MVNCPKGKAAKSEKRGKPTGHQHTQQYHSQVTRFFTSPRVQVEKTREHTTVSQSGDKVLHVTTSPGAEDKSTRQYHSQMIRFFTSPRVQVEKTREHTTVSQSGDKVLQVTTSPGGVDKRTANTTIPQDACGLPLLTQNRSKRSEW